VFWFLPKGHPPKKSDAYPTLRDLLRRMARESRPESVDPLFQSTFRYALYSVDFRVCRPTLTHQSPGLVYRHEIDERAKAPKLSVRCKLVCGVRGAGGF
jgi:hypothetical protein